MNKELLRRPFLQDQIKQREGHKGKMLSYVETHAVIARLNEGCDAWNFEVVEHQVYKAEVVVVGKLIADGVIKMAFGGSAITIDRNGKVMSLADDLKAAASDALKKCASLLGVGLELYSGSKNTTTEPSAHRPSNAMHASGESRSAPPPRSQTRPGQDRGAPRETATERQLGALRGVFQRKSITGAALVNFVAERTGKQRLEQLTRGEASNLLSELAQLNGAHR